MEEIGKLIHELFDEQREELKDLRSENRRCDRLIRGVADIIREHTIKSKDDGWYVSSIWAKDAVKLFELLGFDWTEEEEE